ncbi:MAG: hypothetical protein AAB443_00795 [Patescibacteria group bacterium]
MKSFRFIIIFLFVLLIVAGGVVTAKAAFENSGEVSGVNFSVGSADIKLLNDLSKGTEEENLLDTKNGPSFENIYSGWSEDYMVKLYNKGSLKMALNSNSDYTAADDPAGLREYIFVEVFEWADTNSNGAIEPEEVSAIPIAKKTVLKWKTEGIDLGFINPLEVKGYVLRFSLSTIPSTKAGESALYKFVFNGTTDGVSQ